MTTVASLVVEGRFDPSAILSGVNAAVAAIERLNGAAVALSDIRAFATANAGDGAALVSVATQGAEAIAGLKGAAESGFGAIHQTATDARQAVVDLTESLAAATVTASGLVSAVRTAGAAGAGGTLTVSATAASAASSALTEAATAAERFNAVIGNVAAAKTLADAFQSLRLSVADFKAGLLSAAEVNVIIDAARASVVALREQGFEPAGRALSQFASIVSQSKQAVNDAASGYAAMAQGLAEAGRQASVAQQIVQGMTQAAQQAGPATSLLSDGFAQAAEQATIAQQIIQGMTAAAVESGTVAAPAVHTLAAGFAEAARQASVAQQIIQGMTAAARETQAQANASAAALGNAGSSAARLGTNASGSSSGLNILRRGLFAVDASALGASSSLGNVGAGVLLLGADLPVVLALGAAVGVLALAWDAANAATAQQQKDIDQVVTQLNRAQQAARERTPLGMKLEVDALNDQLKEAEGHLRFLNNLNAPSNPIAPFIGPFLQLFGFIDRAQGKVNDVTKAISAQQEERKSADIAAANAEADAQAQALNAELALAQAGHARLAAINDANFQADTESLVQFYATRLRITKQSIADEVAAQQKRIDAIILQRFDPTDPNVRAEQDKRNKDLQAAQAELTRITVDGETKVIQQVAEEAAARRQLSLQRLTFEAQIAGVQGQTHTQALDQIQQQVDAFERFQRIATPGISAPDLAGRVSDFANALLVQASFQEKQQAAERTLADLERQRTGIQDQLTNGTIGEAQASFEEANATRGVLDTLTAQLDVLRQAAGVNPVLLKQFEDMQSQVASLAASLEGVPKDVGIQVRIGAFEETANEVQRLTAELSALPAGSPLIAGLVTDLDTAKHSLKDVRDDLLATATAALQSGQITANQFTRILALVQKLDTSTRHWLGALQGIHALAQGIAGIAGAFGNIDESTRKALEGVQGLTQGIHQFVEAIPADGIGGSFAGIAGGIFAGVAALGSLGAALFGGGPDETTQMLAEANQHLADIELSLNFQLDTQQGLLDAQKAVQSIQNPDTVKRLQGLEAAGVFNPDHAQAQERDLINQLLAGTGLDFDTLAALARQQNIPLIDSDGLINPALLDPFVQHLGLAAKGLDKLSQAADAALNVPEGFRLKALEFAAQDPQSGLGGPTTTGLSIDPGRVTRPIQVTGGSLVTININGSTGQITTQQITAATLAGLRQAGLAQTGDTLQGTGIL